MFSVYFVSGQNRAAPTSKPMSVPPQSPYEDTVAGAGIVEAETENIAIGSSTPGVVVEVYVKVGKEVKAGDKLFRLDDRMQQAELRNRQAALESAKADLVRLEHQPRPEQLRMSSAQVDRGQGQPGRTARPLQSGERPGRAQGRDRRKPGDAAAGVARRPGSGRPQPGGI